MNITETNKNLLNAIIADDIIEHQENYDEGIISEINEFLTDWILMNESFNDFKVTVSRTDMINHGIVPETIYNFTNADVEIIDDNDMSSGADIIFNLAYDILDDYPWNGEYNEQIMYNAQYIFISSSISYCVLIEKI